MVRRSAAKNIPGEERTAPLLIAAVCFMALGLAACQATVDASPENSAQLPSSPELLKPSEEATAAKYYPSDEPLRLGVEHFKSGEYGLAEQYFRDAVEKSRKDATAWIGLAASYDHLGRFDLADRAYRSAIQLKGETVQILNNEGYSYLLRGDLRRARAKFNLAAQRDPTSPTIANNLHLLDASTRYIERAPDAADIE